MLRSTFFASILALCLANPVIIQPQAANPEILASYSYALDFAQAATVSQFTCLYNGGYRVAFVRSYAPQNNGSFDYNSVTNIKNAYSAGVGTEIYMTPALTSTKTASQQIDEVYNNLVSNSITVRSIWIQVTSPVNWGTSTSANVNFISSLVLRAQQRGLSVGIYTNVYDWNQITNNWTGLSSTVSLWYWSVNGGGTSGETPANFNDFRSFGPWTYPTVKQFAQTESVCSISPLNRNVYSSGSKAASMLHRESTAENIIVGGHFN